MVQNVLYGIGSVLLGLILGSVLNITVLNLGTILIPAPEGADVSTMEGLRDSMHLFLPKNFLFPFLAHASGTFLGSLIAAMLRKEHASICAYAIGFLFFLGGLINVIYLPSPLWFTLVDLIFAYLPMSYCALVLVSRIRSK
ncbi:hypothetical protein LPTSP4_09960 [Leptospira ryugenii]|uniref:Uncharacterized protein n=1 Tax=Leptospira ryugenii TaxID=1917863 RepID=A0A2P2DXY2_9LEPT|nr:hypothetical protein [Leptospira ryugenii]GBF49483.1 hypothetical protein LPTSP4_09960 [Leptospira ryugenii]